MDVVVAVAFGVLALIFIGSVLALIIVCRQRRHAKEHMDDHKPILQYSRDNIPGWNGTDSEFEDVLQLSPNIAKILRENEFSFDGSGVVQNCLAILRLCHQITDKLSGLSFAMNSAPQSPQQQHTNQDMLEEVNSATRKVMPRVDDLVRTMYAGTRKGVIQTPLFEARAAALAMACSALVVSFRAVYGRRVPASDVQWLSEALKEMDAHLDSVRLVAHQEELMAGEKVEVIMESPMEEEEAANSGCKPSQDENDDDGPSTSSGLLAANATSTETPGTSNAVTYLSSGRKDLIVTLAEIEECPADPHVAHVNAEPSTLEPSTLDANKTSATIWGRSGLGQAAGAEPMQLHRAALNVPSGPSSPGNGAPGDPPVSNAAGATDYPYGNHQNRINTTTNNGRHHGDGLNKGSKTGNGGEKVADVSNDDDPSTPCLPKTADSVY